ncbi:MAG: DUF2442 domain-containing protein [Bacteroidetes bacterium]|nr:DUF2442 domain-containing protein [Bacteroidota bacterium]
MKITVNYKENYKPDKIVKIIQAEYLDNYRIFLKFNDGKEQVVDFEYFISNAQHPDIKKYMDKTLFKNFDIVNGNLNWNDYDMIFPIWDLYQGEIEQKKKRSAVAEPKTKYGKK